MAFTREKRENIKLYMMEKIDEGDDAFVRKTAEAFGTSKNTIYRYVRELSKDGMIEKKDGKFRLLGKIAFYSIDISETVNEDRIFDEYIKPEIQSMKENVFSIWLYCFSEMFNNVLDHSEADTAYILIKQNPVNTTVVIHDNGVGIFSKIKEHYHFESLDDAVIELFKGKLTTDKSRHSGEGIFFSSRMMDVFAAVSDGKIFSHTEYDEVMEDMDGLPEDFAGAGTTIMMQLHNDSKKTSREIFDRFATADGGFTKTKIPMKNLFTPYPVSRSQARRLAHRLENFKEVELDFSEVPELGQGFAHEIFIVFCRNHKEVEIIATNTNDHVKQMINHVKNS